MLMSGASIASAPVRFEQFDHFSRLFARASHEDAPPKQRPCIEPAQVIPKPHDFADDQHRGPRRLLLAKPIGEISQRARDGCL